MFFHISSEDAKEAFFECFSKDEKWKIWNLLGKADARWRKRPEDIDKFFETGISTKNLFDFLRMFASGIYGCRGMYHKVVEDDFPELKKQLAALDLPAYMPERNAGKTSEYFPPYPDEAFEAENPAVGKVIVTFHAWNQYSKRFQNTQGIKKLPVLEAQRRVMESFQRCFHGSKETDILTYHRVIRLINNDFKPVRYFYHSPSNFRFVVRMDDPPVIVTAEIARK